ncbi:MAG: hypothetical protein KW788_03715 [Candidatus Doudnabacteria bacterium]|nr:hypothetical protein [Candidatus Doudnabacteria bacterium]
MTRLVSVLVISAVVAGGLYYARANPPPKARGTHATVAAVVLTVVPAIYIVQMPAHMRYDMSMIGEGVPPTDSPPQKLIQPVYFESQRPGDHGRRSTATAPMYTRASASRAAMRMTKLKDGAYVQYFARARSGPIVL